MKPVFNDLLERADVEDIVLKPTGLAYFSQGQWHGPSPTPECSKAELRDLAEHIAEGAALTLGLTQPTADGYLHAANGQAFRAHVAIEPLVSEGPEITLRRLPHAGRLTLTDFALSLQQQERLTQAVREGAAVLVAGSTGAGKTSLLSALLELLPPSTRVLVLEDTPELPLPTPLSSKLLSRQNRFGFREGAQWQLSDLVYESLRMRPQRLVLGECRGPEAFAILQALQTGHRGLMTSIHAGSCHEAIERFKLLARAAAPAGSAIPDLPWDLVLHLTQENGRRYVSDVFDARA